MLAWWWELMPLFVVRWLALRYCERLWASATLRVAMPRPDVLVRVPTPKREPWTAKEKGLIAGDGKPCPNNHDPDCRWPQCNCRQWGQ